MERELIEILEKLGLSRQEAKVYISLLIRGEATASELSDLSGVPYTKVYDILSSLESKGYVTAIPGRPMRYRPVDPKIAVSLSLDRIKRELMQKLKEVEEASALAVNKLARYFKGVEEDFAVYMVKGRASAMTQIKTLVLTCETPPLVVATKNTLERLKKNIGDVLEKKNAVIKVLDNGINIIVTENTLVLYRAVPDDTSADSRYDIALIIKCRNIGKVLREATAKQS